jgi:hypothetical protein
MKQKEGFITKVKTIVSNEEEQDKIGKITNLVFGKSTEQEGSSASKDYEQFVI